jgi:hypothetical protein
LGPEKLEGSIPMKYSLKIFEIFLTCGFRVLGQAFRLNILLATDSVLFMGKCFLSTNYPSHMMYWWLVTSLFTLAPSVY